jgi:hypothetical protein
LRKLGRSTRRDKSNFYHYPVTEFIRFSTEAMTEIQRFSYRAR